MKKELFTTKKKINKTKIGIISDIHYYEKYKQKILDNLLNQIKEEKPNYFVIAGDILDKSNYKYDRLLTFLNDISNICPVIMILGNHDIYKRVKGKIVEDRCNNFINDISSNNNIHLLEDNNYLDNNINFYGFDFPTDYYYKERERYGSFIKNLGNIHPKLDSKNYNIVLFHSPTNIFRYIERNPDSNLAKADLIISGHMHNGCIPYIITNIFNKIFKSNRSLISPEKTLFPKYSQGRVYKIRDGIIYEGVSKLSASSGILHKLDCIYHKQVKFIEIENEE